MSQSRSWTPITRNKPEIEGVHPQKRGLLVVKITLSQDPPEPWRQAFLNPTEVPVSASMHPPKVYGEHIAITPPESELREYVLHVDERIASANTYYQTTVWPALEQKRKQEEDQAQDSASR